ncbi:DNA FtsK/SpoIIIE translocase [Bacillus phage BC01]|nr:DNA FtsK/SpoIIIE translocase [Bacillus phage BC01]
MEKESECVFGVELSLRPGVMGATLVTPSFLRLGEQKPSSESIVIGCMQGLTYYEGYLVEPNFLPLYGAFNGFLLNALSEMYMKEDELVELQWLFRKRYDDWRTNAIDRYASYLEGNDYPLGSRFGRGFQDKMLKVLNKISSFDMARPYNQAVEEKIMDEVYQFQLRVVVHSEAPEDVRKRLELILSQYDSHNALRLYKRKPKGFRQEYLSFLMTADTEGQILSRKEIASLFGGDLIIADNVQTEVQETIVPKAVKTGGLISLLPEYNRPQVEVDEGIVADIAGALKRVGLVSKARVENSTITAGIRLSVVQCSIPKGKTLTQLISKAKDIQAALGVASLSIEQGDTPDTVRFTLPNKVPSVIGLRELLEAPEFHSFAEEQDLPFIVGVDEINQPIYLSLSKLVHLMIAGTTGSGKSVFMNTLILCLLSTYPPELLRFYMVDPKLVELSHYKGLPHVEHVVTDMGKAAAMLSKLTKEMDRRYSQFSENGVKNIKLYNEKVEKKMPYIVCVIDEYADLQDMNPEVEEYIARLGQKARAAGIHMVIATQRPSADIISGRIKSVIPNAISFKLNGNTDYKTVFSKGIPHTLLGRGDGVMKIEGWSKEFQRFQGGIVSPDEKKEEEVFQKITDYFSSVTVAPILDNALEAEEDNSVEYLITEDDLLARLKGVIADTKETKVGELRNLMKIKAETLTALMNRLVEEGWLTKHKSKAKGYELTIDELTLARYKSKK